MANLTSTYMGITLKNPLVVGACSLTSNMDAIRKIETKGAGALVIKSLFEEQIAYQRYAHDEDIHLYDNWHAEMQSIFPEVEHAGPEEHLMWTQRAKESVSIPVIASLNALNIETWAEWAKKLEETGVDGLELNFFGLPDDLIAPAQEIEKAQVEAVQAVKKAVKIPVSVKLSSFYTSPVRIIQQLEKAGVDGFVLFNRFFHPSINVETETSSYPFNLSGPADHKLALRFMGLLHGQTKASLCASNGIHTSQEALEVLLAGADVFQTVSTLYLNSLDQITTILGDIQGWMRKKGYEKIDDFRGKLSEAKNGDTSAYRRAQYVRMLLRSQDYIKRPNLI
ncbi:dihydroorotate dehydrogenase-like protein [Spirochaeta lutea]|uniref:Dihydroorotate dehydrogenase n=1 Tax=Spirochaeta lutea TaxID=1480694 RepID=A0A098QZ93_9SPIO|nr:dihydroorotate dehydrogenase-like protein [Spirochaeta lutea]KGE72801.1 dihydroorotate dehydrogenase [Spirochaeta lutea]